MTEAKLEKIKTIAFHQAAFARLFFIKGEIVRCEAEISVHEMESLKWGADVTEENAMDCGFASRDLKMAYCKSLMEAYKKEVEELGKTLTLEITK